MGHQVRAGLAVQKLNKLRMKPDNSFPVVNIDTARRNSIDKNFLIRELVKPDQSWLVRVLIVFHDPKTARWHGWWL